MTGEGNGHYCYEDYGQVPDFFDFDNTNCQKHCFDENRKMKYKILFNSNLGTACRTI